MAPDIPPASKNICETTDKREEDRERQKIGQWNPDDTRIGSYVGIDDCEKRCDQNERAISGNEIKNNGL